MNFKLTTADYIIIFVIWAVWIYLLWNMLDKSVDEKVAESCQTGEDKSSSIILDIWWKCLWTSLVAQVVMVIVLVYVKPMFIKDNTV